MEFEGVYPAIITPLDETNKLKEEEFRKVVEFNIQAVNVCLEALNTILL